MPPETRTQEAGNDYQGHPDGPAPVRVPPAPRRRGKAAKMDGVVTARKPGKKALIHVTVWPEGAGDPYPLDVELLDDGWFYLDKRQKGPRYRLKPGTVVYEGGKYRTNVREGVFETIDIQAIQTGKPHPDELDGLLVGDILKEMAEAARRQISGWQKAGAIGVGLMAILLVGVMIWAIVSLGNNLTAIEQAIQGLAHSGGLGGGTAAGPPPGSGAAAGHQPIAPGGR